MDSTHNMSAFECYKEYLALKNHFTKPSYDYFKYHGKSRVSQSSFESRNDKLYFMKVAKHPDPIKYILSNLVENDKTWIKEIAYSPAAEKVYTDWLKRQQSLLYNFKEELNHLKPDFDSNFKVESHSHPYVLSLFLRKELSIETLAILASITNCIPYWRKKLEYDPVAEEVINKIVKYRPFLNYDKDKVKEIVLDKFGDMA